MDLIVSLLFSYWQWFCNHCIAALSSSLVFAAVAASDHECSETLSSLADERTIDASEERWVSRLKVVPEAQRFKLAGIDPELEVKLGEMFKGIVATGDKAWAPSSGTLPTDFIEHVYNEAHEEVEEENAIDDVSMLRQVGCDKNNESLGIQIEPTQHVQEKRKSTKTTHFNASDNMSNATSILTPAMAPFDIPEAGKILGEMSEEIPEESDIYYFALELIANKDKRTMFL
ncbi:hypothetical protein V6N12_001372 [Hibiscus sabdariffa]|uniref:Uncharacterized protein n=1 Tax=Hibiscus sabdariffa TaxID=183260 RepID=A0ABR2AV30_9ROSI